MSGQEANGAPHLGMLLDGGTLSPGDQHHLQLVHDELIMLRQMKRRARMIEQEGLLVDGVPGGHNGAAGARRAAARYILTGEA